MATTPTGGVAAPPSLLAPAQGEDLTWLLDLLRSVQLEQFYVRLRDQLQVSRLEHFEFVTVQDLEKVYKHLITSHQAVDNLN